MKKPLNKPSLDPLQKFISKIFDDRDQVKAASTWRFIDVMGESYYYKNIITRRGVILDGKGNPVSKEGGPLVLQEVYNKNYGGYAKILKYRPQIEWFKKYALRESVGNKIKSVLSEAAIMNKIPVPRTFDHLRWELDDYKKIELERFVNQPIDVVSETDFKNMSKFFGIPEKNLISIHNTYSPKRNTCFVDEAEDIKRPNLSKGLVVTSRDAGLNTQNMNSTPKGNGKVLKLTQDFKTAAQRKTEKQLGNWGIKPNQETHLMQYPRMDEFLMIYLNVDFKPLSLDKNPTNKLIMSINEVEADSEFYQSLGESLEKFNEVYGTGYILTGSYVKEGEEKCIIDVDWIAPSKDKLLDYGALVKQFGEKKASTVYQDRIKKIENKERLVKGLEKNHYDRAYNREFWDKDKSKIMRQFMSGELGYSDSF